MGVRLLSEDLIERSGFLDDRAFETTNKHIRVDLYIEWDKKRKNPKWAIQISRRRGTRPFDTFDSGFTTFYKDRDEAMQVYTELCEKYQGVEIKEPDAGTSGGDKDGTE